MNRGRGLARGRPFGAGRGRSSPSADHTPMRHSPVSRSQSDNDSPVTRYPSTGTENVTLAEDDSGPKHSRVLPEYGSLDQQCNVSRSPQFSAKKDQRVVKNQEEQQDDAEGSCRDSYVCSPVVGATSLKDESSEKIGSGTKGKQFKSESRCEKISPEKACGSVKSTDLENMRICGSGRRDSDHLATGFSFNICSEKGKFVTLKPPLLAKNRELRNHSRLCMDRQNIHLLRPGLVLMKSYISLEDQVKLVKKCSDLGVGPGGFYQPAYRDGAKLQLKMMCLGKNWDPETSKYSDQRPADGAKPPVIPDEFHQLVKAALRDSCAYLLQLSKDGKKTDVLPSMSPDICIVNFYSKSGRLGLHQDKDESRESIGKGLPVVSFSVGDSAEFLYGDQRDIFLAEKVKLESGDILIFGGKSRLIYHGVDAIYADTAPKTLLEETNLRPGRLNLTFREY